MKAWTIALKDIVTRLRDRRAILLTVVTPLILTAIVGAAFSGLLGEGDEAPIQDIALVIVNDDEGDLGWQVADLLTAPELADLPEPVAMADLETARASIETGDAVAVVYIPPDFSASVQQYGAPSGAADNGTKIQLYTDPVNTIQAGIAESVVSQIVAGFNSAVLATQVSIEQVLTHTTDGDITAIAAAAEKEIQATFGDENRPRINLDRGATSGNSNLISTSLSYLALSLAIFFLSFSLFDNIRSLLDEQREGTLNRLITTNTGISQILLGKIGGALLLGVLQLALLIVATRLLFNLSWGRSIPGLILMVVATAVAVTSLGTFLATFAHDIRQASILAGVIVLISAALGGSFFPPYGFPDWLQKLSYLTINRWAIDGLVDLIIRNLTLGDVLLEGAVLFGFAGILFVLSVWHFPRRIKR
jgi:ABC-2 type transport system permease protein